MPFFHGDLLERLQEVEVRRAHRVSAISLRALSRFPAADDALASRRRSLRAVGEGVRANAALQSKIVWALSISPYARRRDRRVTRAPSRRRRGRRLRQARPRASARRRPPAGSGLRSGGRRTGGSARAGAAGVPGPARDFELVPARRSNSLTVDRSRYRLARRREGVQVDSTVAVNRHYDVAGSELDVHEIEASGLKQRRGDALYVI